LDRLPSQDDRQWLTHALKKIIARRGADLLDAAPLVEPTNDWFPEKWATTAAHGHRLAQRLMHYAGLGELSVSLSAYKPVWNDDEEAPWDAGTAGWFAGIRDRRAFFGLHVRQFGDPEAAAGVLAHEVAHAWRRHHHLVVEDREKEEPLTDVTTVALGFGILTTNNTDRYRSSGTWSMTAWSMSSAGYLSPQAMSWLLAVWCTARSVAGERRTIERHLEPNQQSYFRASLEELDRSDSGARELLRAAGRPPQRILHAVPANFVPRDPSPDEIDEPEKPSPDPQVNRGTMVYQKARGEVTVTAFMAGLAAWFVAWIAALSIDESSMTRALLVSLMVASVAAAIAGSRARRPACSACNTRLDQNPAICPGCGGTVGARVGARELRRIREEDLDRRAARDVGYEECDACEPENPCPAHAPTFAIGVGSDEDLDRSSGAPLTIPVKGPGNSERPVSGRFLKRFGAVFFIMAGMTLALAFWRQNHVAVYIDNPLGSPVTLAIDGERFVVAGRPPVALSLKPGKHRIVVTEANREIEHTEVVVDQQPLQDALTQPRFYVYSVAGRGLYRCSRLVYSARKQDRGTTSTLIAFQRWIRQDEVDFLFTSPPDHLSGSRSKTRATFEIEDLSLREISYELEREGKHEDAVLALRRGVDSDPCDTATRQDLVELVSAQGKKGDAHREATAWVSACDQSLEAHRTYQDVLGQSGGKDSLLKVYRERLRKEPSAVNHYLCGRLLHGEPAIAEFREALRLDHDVPWAGIALGRQLLEAEQDVAAYNVLDQAMLAKKVEGIGAVYFAMAAVGTQKQDEALARLPDANRVDGDSLWTAKWILARSKNDWSAARVLLADREADQPTSETRILRARLERDAGGTVDSLADDLENNLETRSAAVQLRFEEAWQTGRLREAAAMNLAPLRENDAAIIDDIYAIEAAMLAHTPGALAKSSELRAKLSALPELLALLDAAEGRISKETLMTRIAGNTLGWAPHAWFALAVHASLSGGDASTLFRKSAERALDREFPYRLGLRMAENPALR
jgi:hypothetical protein